MNFLKKNKYGLLSFLLPFMVMTGIMIATKSRPFGENSFMIVDALHQYLPFFSNYQQKLQSLDSLFYSWQGGLGYNFYSLWAYYLSSPLNFIVALVPKLTMISVLNWLIAVKFALCSLTGFIYFTHKEGKQSLKNAAFGMCYAFSSYMTGYYWNVMWLEVMIFLPIILLGMDRLIEGKDCKVYILALFGAMFCNYYMAFMVCVFLVLWYFTYYFTDFRSFFTRGVTFAVSSLTAAAMAAILLIPAYKGLMSTSSAYFEFPGWTFYGKWLDLFSTHMVAVAPNNMAVDDGLGNLYCGILPLIVLLLYIIDTKFEWKEKLSKIIILVFLGISFQVEILNFLWHGFHDQYGIPNRFAFLYIFLILIMAYEQLTRMEKERTAAWKVLLSVAVLLGAVAFVYKQEQFDDLYAYAITAGLLILYGILLMIPKRVARTVLYIFVITEVCTNAVYGFYESGQVDAQYYFSDTLAVNDITKRVQPNLYNRMEVLDSKMLDESIWYNMNAVTMFGSTALGATVDAMDQLGFYTGVNEYLYEGGTPVTDMLLGVRGILVRDNNYMHRTHYEYVFNSGNVSLYEHNLPTAIGYSMNGEAADFDDSSYNPFVVQNNLVSAAFANDPVYHLLPVPKPEGDGCTIDEHENGQSYVKVKENMDALQASVVYTFNIEEEQELYLHFDGAHVEDASLCVNHEELQSGRKDSQILTVGNLQKGDVVTLTLWLKEGKSGDGSITMRAAALDELALEDLYHTMSPRKVKVDSYDSTHIEGNVHAFEDGSIFFGIPYDEGWTVYVDDVACATEPFAGGFLSVKVPEGEHQIQLKYQPPGFSIGWKISLIGWLLFLLGTSYSRKRKNKIDILGGNSNEEEIDEDCGIDTVYDHDV